MYQQHWLKAIYRQLANPTCGLVVRRQRTKSMTASVIVERFEPRQMLAGQAIAVGPEIQVNTYTLNDQTNPAIAMDSAGAYVVTWASSGQDGSGEGVYAQRYNASGVAQGSEFRVNTTTTGSQSAPAVAIDSSGDFVIAFSSSSGMFAQRYNAAGAVQGSEFEVGSSGTLGTPKVAMDATGDFVIAWSTYGGTGGVTAQRYNAAGISQGTPIQVGSGPINSGSDVAMDATGGFVIAWTSYVFTNAGAGGPPGINKTDREINAQIFNASGTPLGNQISVNSSIGGVPSDPEVAMDAAGDFTVVWQGYSYNGQTRNVVFQTDQVLFNAAGTNSTELPGLPTSETPTVALEAANEFVFGWGGGGISLEQSFNGGGSIVQLPSNGTSSQTLPAVAMDAAGDFVVAWESNGPDGSGYGIFTQRFEVQTAPIVSGIGGTTTFVHGGAPLTVAPELVITAPQDQELVSATVSFTNWQAEDRVSFLNSLALQHSFTQDLAAHTATLTITGAATAAQYQTLLRSVVYQDVAGSPNTSVMRTATFAVNDGTFTGSASQNLVVATVLSGLNGTTTYVQGEDPLSIAPEIVVAAPQGQQILSATVSFTNWQAEDRVSFFNSLALQHSFTQNLVAHTATLTITGANTAAGYQTLLRSVVYQDPAGIPNTAAKRIATFTVNDGVSNYSGTQTVMVTTVLSGLSGTSTYVQGSGPQMIAPNLIVTASGSPDLVSATVSFTNWQAEDRVSFFNTFALQHTFTQNLTTHTATLAITGTDTLAHYQTLLRSVVYQDVAGAPNTSTKRVATITVNDGSKTSSASQTITVVAHGHAL